MQKIVSFFTFLPIVLSVKLCYAADTWKLTGAGSGGVTDVTDQINAAMKSTADNLLPVASIVSFLIAAGYIMFSSQSGWKRFINAAIGSVIGFGAVLIVGSIYGAVK